MLNQNKYTHIYSEPGQVHLAYVVSDIDYVQIEIIEWLLNNIVRCCIYLMTYDWIKSFLKITIEGRHIYVS
jgi:hypothetical protein